MKKRWWIPIIILVYLVGIVLGSLLFTTYESATQPQSGEAFVFTALTISIPIIIVSLLRVFIIGKDKPGWKHIFYKGIAVLTIWLIFLLFLGAIISAVFNPSDLNPPYPNSNYSFEFVMAAFVALSFWLIDSAAKATMDLFKSGTEKNDS